MSSITIPLTQDKSTIIDVADYDLVMRFKWSATKGRKTWYARRGYTAPDGRYRHIQLHRFLLDAPDGIEVDHIDGDGLNNRRSNLRLATRPQNIHNQGMKQGTQRPNTSGYKGVYPSRGHWAAAIAGRYLGEYASAEQAAKAYDTAARETFGEFARLNFPESLEVVAPSAGKPRAVGNTGYRGVCIRRRPGRRDCWTARIIHDGVRVVLGTYHTPEDAARAFDAKSRELFGASAHLNFPD